VDEQPRFRRSAHTDSNKYKCFKSCHRRKPISNEKEQVMRMLNKIICKISDLTISPHFLSGLSKLSKPFKLFRSHSKNKNRFHYLTFLCAAILLLGAN